MYHRFALALFVCAAGVHLAAGDACTPGFDQMTRIGGKYADMPDQHRKLLVSRADIVSWINKNTPDLAGAGGSGGSGEPIGTPDESLDPQDRVQLRKDPRSIWMVTARSDPSDDYPQGRSDISCGLSDGVLTDAMNGRFKSIQGINPNCYIISTMRAYGCDEYDGSKPCVTVEGHPNVQHCAKIAAGYYEDGEGTGIPKRCPTDAASTGGVGIRTGPKLAIPTCKYDAASGGPKMLTMECIVEVFCDGPATVLTTDDDGYVSCVEATCPAGQARVTPAANKPETWVFGEYEKACGSVCEDCESGKFSDAPRRKFPPNGNKDLTGGCTPHKTCAPGEYAKVPGTALADTQCAATLCAVNEKVVGNACVGCPAGKTNDAGADATGDDTTCTAIVCTTPTVTTGYTTTETNLDLSQTTTPGPDAFEVTVECAAGYEGTATATTCSASGAYGLGGCAAIVCTTPTDTTGYTTPTETTLDLSKTNTPGPDAFEVTVECAAGYEGNAAATTCSASGAYGLAGCAAIVCTTPTDTAGYTITDGNLDLSKTNTPGPNAFEVTVECAAGYEGNAAATTCSTSGAYGLAGCTAIVCTTPTDTTGYTITDGNLNLSQTATPGPDAFKETAVCAPGYKGDAVATVCNTSGPYTLSGCESVICLANESVSSNKCVACANGKKNDAGDVASGDDTECDKCGSDSSGVGGVAKAEKFYDDYSCKVEKCEFPDEDDTEWVPTADELACEENYCKPGLTFSSNLMWDGKGPCSECGTCDEDEIEMQPCTVAHDVKCEKLIAVDGAVGAKLPVMATMLAAAVIAGLAA